MLLLLRRGAGDRRRLIPSSSSSSMLPWSSFSSFSSSSLSSSSSELLDEPEAVIIALGGNMGDVPAAMSSALARLPYRRGGSSSSQEEEPTSFVLATSRLFASRPAYVEDQPPFLNAAAAVVTRLPPLRLLRALKGLERDAGRGRGGSGEQRPAVRFGPRPLDLDVVFYGGLRGSFFEESEGGSEGERDEDDAAAADAVAAAVAQGLELPHPRWRERAFVMAPVCDLVGGVEEPEAAEEEEEEESESAGSRGRESRFGSGLRLFGFPDVGDDERRQRRRRRRPSLRPPGVPFPLPSRGSAEAISRSLCEAARRWTELCSDSSSSPRSARSPEADCRLGEGGEGGEGGGEGGGASSQQCWPVLPLPHGLGGWRAQARRPRVMAVLNVTPDSFSDGGRLMVAKKKKEAKGAASAGAVEEGSSGGGGGGDDGGDGGDDDDDPPPDIPAVLAAAHLAVSRGADLLDVGGQSTRPGARRVPEALEARRVLPVVRALAADARLRRLRVPISVDTFYASVAERALAAGAHIINDVTGGKGDGVEGKMAAAVARGRGALVLTHNRGGGGQRSKVEGPRPAFDPSGGSADSDYGAFGGDVAMGVAEELAEAVESAVAAGAGKRGVRSERGGGGGDDPPLLLPWSLALDPGLGFSKTRGQNLSLLARTEDVRSALPPQFRTMPVLVGASRKGFLSMGAPAAAAAGRGSGDEGAPEAERGGGAGGEGERENPDLHPRDAATFASSAIAAAHGADLLRVHEISRNREAAGVGAEVRWSRVE